MLESYIDEKTAVNDIEEFHPRTRDELQKELVKESEENTVPGVSFTFRVFHWSFKFLRKFKPEWHRCFLLVI